MVRRPEQADAPPVAGAQQRPNGLARAEFLPRTYRDSAEAGDRYVCLAKSLRSAARAAKYPHIP